MPRFQGNPGDILPSFRIPVLGIEVTREGGLYTLLAVDVTLLIIVGTMILMSSLKKNKFNVEGRTVVITGGSQGMGRGLARLLSQKGANICIVARNAKKLQDAKEYIAGAAKSPQTQRFHFIAADVTKPDENTRIIREVTSWNDGNAPDVVWANAGSASPSLFLDASVETLKAQMDINYWAAVYLAQASLRAWLQPSSPPNKTTATLSDGKKPSPPQPVHFITTSSVAAFAGLAGYVPYSPCKAALRSLHDTLRNELNLYNNSPSQAEVKLHAVFPGTILSPGLEEENKTKHPVTKMLEQGDPAQTEDQVAAAAVSELEKGRRIVSTQMLGAAMRAGAMQGSVRDRWFVDTVFGWVMGAAWLFVVPDLERKVRAWAKKNGTPKHD